MKTSKLWRKKLEEIVEDRKLSHAHELAEKKYCENFQIIKTDVLGQSNENHNKILHKIWNNTEIHMEAQKTSNS